jgi:putative endonuclease
MSWSVYMVRCADRSLYTGITTDLTRRLQEHNSVKSRTKYTRSRRPVSLVYSRVFYGPGAARAAKRLEARIKRQPKKTKEQWAA